MTGINKQIFDVLKDNRSLSPDYELRDMLELIEHFLSEEEYTKRVRLAKEIAKRALTRHGKESLHPFVSSMVDIERGVQQFNRRLRDHINHSVYVYLLGLVFMEKYHQCFGNIDPLSWKIAALLHDIGYPLEWFSKSIGEYLKAVSEASEVLPNYYYGIRHEVRISQIQLLKFCENHNAFQTIDNKLSNWNILINHHHFDMQQVFTEGLAQGKINHGMLSSLTVLKIIDSLYFRNNRLREEYKSDQSGLDWGEYCFSRQIIPAVAAISVHAVADQIDGVQLEVAPIAYLLILCDTLQLWSRYSPGRKMYGSSDISISFQSNTIFVKSEVDNDDFTEIEGIVVGKLTAENFNLRVERS